jgi:hypothetical protein
MLSGSVGTPRLKHYKHKALRAVTLTVSLNSRERQTCVLVNSEGYTFAHKSISSLQHRFIYQAVLQGLLMFMLPTLK